MITTRLPGFMCGTHLRSWAMSPQRGCDRAMSEPRRGGAQHGDTPCQDRRPTRRALTQTSSPSAHSGPAPPRPGHVPLEYRGTSTSFRRAKHRSVSRLTGNGSRSRCAGAGYEPPKDGLVAVYRSSASKCRRCRPAGSEPQRCPGQRAGGTIASMTSRRHLSSPYGWCLTAGDCDVRVCRSKRPLCDECHPDDVDGMLWGPCGASPATGCGIARRRVGCCRRCDSHRRSRVARQHSPGVELW